MMFPKNSFACTWGGLALAAPALFAGCMPGWVGVPTTAQLVAQGESARGPKVSPISARRVKLDGQGLSLGELQEASLSSQQLVEQVDRLIRENRYGSARRLVQKFPEVALEHLRLPTGSATSTATAMIAASYDTVLPPSSSSSPRWPQALKAAATDSAAYATARQQFEQHLHNGRFAEAVALQLPAKLGAGDSPMREADARHLLGMAHFAAGAPAEAATEWKRAAEIAGQFDPAWQAQLLLLTSEAQRRAGDAERATSTWQESVRRAAALLNQSTPFMDPVFWERALALHPVTTPWPAEIRAALIKLPAWARVEGLADSQETATASSQVGTEILLWAHIGHWRLLRDEAQGALVAFKRSEAVISETAVKDRLQLEEARSLVRLGQTAPATAILVRLSGSAHSPASRPARAVLGTMRLQANNPKQGYLLLQKALADETPFPGRSSALADFGIACLMTGDEPAGLQALHTAQQQFQSAGDLDQLASALENEAAYLTKKEKTELVAAVRQRITEIERQ